MKILVSILCCILINPITIGVLVGILSGILPDVGSIRWASPKGGPTYYDEMFKVGFVGGLVLIVYLLYRYRKLLGEQAMLSVGFVQLLILIVGAAVWLNRLQQINMELSMHYPPSSFHDQDQLWIRVGWIIVSLLAGCALFVLGKLFYNAWFRG